MDVARHDADLALAWLDDAGAVRADQARLVLRPHDRLDLDHVEGGDAFGDANNEVHLGFDRLKDCVSSEGRGDVDDRSISIGCLFRIRNGAVDREAQVLRAGLTLVDSTNNLGAVSESLLSVESSLKRHKDLHL